MTQEPYRIILFYAFVDIADPDAMRQEQHELAKAHSLAGRMLIAKEGINATFEGYESDIERYKKAFIAQPLFRDVTFKESQGTGNAFPRLMVKVRDEVVTLGAGSFNVASETAPFVTAKQLHDMYESDEDFVVLDLRNDYEIETGAFERTVHPNLQNFRELPEKIAAISHLKDKKVVAVCTGGIRCEKATCLLRKEGFQDVYQLKDGIHTYMDEYPAQRFKGTLFVFDNRMTTPVRDDVPHEVVGRCVYCGTLSESIYSDDSQRPSRKVICCDACFSANASLRPAVTVD